jgi:hypothetical protein
MRGKKSFAGDFGGKEIIKKKSGERKFSGRSLKTLNSRGEIRRYEILREKSEESKY